MDWISLSKVPGNTPRRTSTRATPILKAGVDSQYRHPFQKAQPNKVLLKNVLHPETSPSPCSIIHSKIRSDGSQLLECGGKKGKAFFLGICLYFFFKKISFD